MGWLHEISDGSVLPEFITGNAWVQLGVGALFVGSQMPWVVLIMRNKLRPNSQFAEVVAAAELRVKQVETDRDNLVAAHDKAIEAKDREIGQWREAWNEERTRGDDATMALAQATVQMGQATSHLVKSVAAPPVVGGTLDDNGGGAPAHVAPEHSGGVT